MDKAKPLFGEPISDWQDWFAWHPSQTWDGAWIWMKKIQRRRIQLHQYLDPTGPRAWWQYRNKGECNG